MTQQSLFSSTLSDLDPDIRFLAEKEELGELRKVYHASKRYTATRVSGWVFTLWGCVYVFLFITIILFSPLHPSPFWTLPGPILVIIGCSMILPRRIYAHWHVYLWESGFLYEKGTLRQVFRWDQIGHIQGSAIYVPQRGRTIFTYNVRRMDGYEVKLHAVFPDIAELIDIVLEAFARSVTTQDLRIAPLRSRTFADFQLDSQGIKNKQEELSWQDLEEITIENGRVTVLKKQAGLADDKGE